MALRSIGPRDPTKEYIKTKVNSYTPEAKDRDLKILELAQKRYDFELQRSKDLDSKAGNLIGYVSVITALILGIGTLRIVNQISEPMHQVLYFGGILSLVISIIFSLLSMKGTPYNFAPTNDDIETFFEKKISVKDAGDEAATYAYVINESARSMHNAFNKNFVRNNTKGNRIQSSWRFLLIGIIMLVAFSILSTVDI